MIEINFKILSCMKCGSDYGTVSCLKVLKSNYKTMFTYERNACIPAKQVNQERFIKKRKEPKYSVQAQFI